MYILQTVKLIGLFTCSLISIGLVYVNKNFTTNCTIHLLDFTEICDYTKLVKSPENLYGPTSQLTNRLSL